MAESSANVEAANARVKTVRFNGEAYLALSKVASYFLESSKPATGKPIFRIFCGGVGAGKTTLRRKQREPGFVQLELSDLVSLLRIAMPQDPSSHSDYAIVLVDMVLQESLASKRNIAIEVIGDSEEVLSSLIEKLLSLGYEVEIRPVHCDFAEARERHLKATANDPEYISSFFSEGQVLMALFSQLGLDKSPVLAQEHRRFPGE